MKRIVNRKVVTGLADASVELLISISVLVHFFDINEF